MADIGNDAFIASAERHYDRFHSRFCDCVSCDYSVDMETAEAWDGDEYYCDWCLEKRLEGWAYDFVREVLFEDEGERSAFFPDLINAEAPGEQSKLQAAE